MVTLDKIKAQLQLEGINSEDDFLQGLCNRAFAVVERTINAKREELNNTELHIFEQAVLLLVGDYYKNREDTTDLNIKSIPNGVIRLCNMIRRYNR